MVFMNMLYYNLIRRIRDVKTMLLMILLPVCAIFILSKVFSPGFSGVPEKKVPVYYTLQSQSPSNQKFSEFISGNKLTEYITPLEKATFPQNPDSSYAYINVSSNGKLYVSLHRLTPMQQDIIKSILQTYDTALSCVITSSRFGAYNGNYNSFNNIEYTAISSSSYLSNFTNSYYCITILVMMLMLGMVNSVHYSAQDKVYYTYMRLKSSPADYWQRSLSSCLASCILLVFQALSVILFTSIIYKGIWAGKLAYVVVICCVSSLFSISLGYLIYHLIQNEVAASTFCAFLCAFFTLAAGGFFPLQLSSLDISFLNYISPSYIIQSAIFNCTRSPNLFFFNTGLIFILALSFLILSDLSGREN